MKLSAIGFCSLSIVHITIASPILTALFRRTDIPSVANVTSALSQYQGLTRLALTSTNSTTALDIIDPLWDPVYALAEGSIPLPILPLERREDVDLADTIAHYLEHLFTLVPVTSPNPSIDVHKIPSTIPPTSLALLQAWADGTLPIPSPSDDSTTTAAPLSIEETEKFIDALQELIVSWRSEVESIDEGEFPRRSVTTVDGDLRKRQLDPLTGLLFLVIFLALR